MTIRAAVLFGVFAYLLWLKLALFDWEPASPSPATASQSRHSSPREVDLSQQAYTFTWEARHGERPAPETAMRIEPTDVYAWWWTGGNGARTLRDTGNGPQKLVLDVQVPSADAFADAPAEGLCAESEAPFMGCQVALSRIVLERDDGNWDLADALLGRRSFPPSTEFTERTGMEFWTREDKAGGRPAFMGWECNGQDWHSAALVLGPPPNPASTLWQRSRCYIPDEGDDRSAKHRLLIQCRNGRDCEMWFLYRQRLVLIDAEHLPPLNAPMLRGMIMMTAWETLNRMHADALHAPAPTQALAEARVQQKVCHALGEEAGLWRQRTASPIYIAARKAQPEPHWGTRQAQEQMEARWNYMANSCRRAGDIAIRLSALAPGEAEEVLADVAASRLPIGNLSSDNEELYAAWFAALEAQGKGETLAMATALAQYLNHASSVGIGTPEWQMRKARAQRLQAIREKLAPTLTDQQLTDFTTPAIAQFEQNWE